MDITYFLKQNRPIWTELEQLLFRFRKQPKRITAADIDQLSHLYKQTAAHLAFIRAYYPADELTIYLNQLVATAHNYAYKEQHTSGFSLSRFLHRYLFTLLHKRLPFIGVATCLFLLGAGFGFAAVQQDPLNLHLVIPAEIANNIDPAQIGKGHDDVNSSLMSTTIMFNNIRVAMLAFVSGITFGLFTIYLLVYNGMLVGALAAVFWQAGKTYEFWAFILPHGIIELTAIFIAGGAGLYMGYRMLVPGQYSRKYQLLEAVKESAQLLVSTIPLFVIAGVIEGYITPSTLSLELKYACACLTLVLLIAAYIYGSFHQHQSKSFALSSK